ncbi:MAG: hypothetical protein P9L92_09135 [Candidatus Electryonea clarkiae]|nr:hypothetical protein [Candidatus Electryonea clarkiae]MDP8288676.1 hypothetical protein [Candidatus Electryonea clarkiae]
MDSIPVSHKRIIAILNNFRESSKVVTTTIEIIKKYNGGFYSNKNTPVSVSFNALFGKLLRANEEHYGIIFIDYISAKDDLGNPTKTARWKIID